MAKLWRFVQKPLFQRLVLLCLTLLLASSLLRYWEPPTRTTITLAVPSPAHAITSAHRWSERAFCPINRERRAVDNGPCL